MLATGPAQQWGRYLFMGTDPSSALIDALESDIVCPRVVTLSDEQSRWLLDGLDLNYLVRAALSPVAAGLTCTSIVLSRLSWPSVSAPAS